MGTVNRTNMRITPIISTIWIALTYLEIVTMVKILTDSSFFANPFCKDKTNEFFTSITRATGIGRSNILVWKMTIGCTSILRLVGFPGELKRHMRKSDKTMTQLVVNLYRAEILALLGITFLHDVEAHDAEARGTFSLSLLFHIAFFIIWCVSGLIWPLILASSNPQKFCFIKRWEALFVATLLLYLFLWAGSQTWCINYMFSVGGIVEYLAVTVNILIHTQVFNIE